LSGIQTGYSQCSILANAVQQTPTLSGGSSYTKFSVAYNPVNNVYYTLNGNYLQTHSTVTGALLISMYSSGLRSIWWNANTSALEGNGYSSLGIVQFTLSSIGYPTSRTTLFSGSNHQPTLNSQGAYDSGNNEIFYFYNGYVYRYSRVTGSLLGTTAVSGLPVAVSSLTYYNVVYTGCSGKEVGVYDRINRRLYFINKSTGAYVGYSQLPVGASSPNSYSISFADDKLWISNGYSWTGYKVSNYGLQTSNILGPFCDNSGVSVNFTINSLTFNTGNIFTAQLSDASGSFSSPTSIGTVTSTTATTITASIPANTTAGGSYRIRVVSSNPVQVGGDNGTNITINVPNVNLGPNVSMCPGDTTVLTAPAGVLSYNWSNGSINQILNVTTANTYTVTVSNGVCSKADTIVVSALTTPTPSLSDTTTVCANSTVLNPGSFTSYSWNTGATSSTLTASTSGLYKVTVTGSNTCTTSDQSYVNLLKPNISTGDTTICVGDTVEMTTSTGCYFSLSTIGNTTYSNTTTYYSAGDDRGGIAVTPNYVYYTGDSYTARYNPNLNSVVSLSRRDGIFSDLSSGQLYTFWNTTYNDFAYSSSYTSAISALRLMDASLNYTGSVINLSQTINASSNSYVFAGSGFVVLWSGYDTHFYKIDLPSGNVTDLGIFDLSSVRYNSESWASWGVAECNGTGYSFVFRANSNSTYGTSYNQITRFNLSTSSFSQASTFNNIGLGDMACITYSPWNSRWYFQSEYSTYFGSNNENLGYANANHNGVGGNSSINSFAWSTGSTLPVINVSPTSTTNYSVTVSHGSVSCADTVAVTVNAIPTFSLSDTLTFCNSDSVQITAGGSFSSYEWSNGATTQSTYVSDLGTYLATVTNSSNCSSTDSTYVNLLDARIDQVDTTICSSDSLRLETLGSCGLKIESLTLNNLTSAYNTSGDDRGGIAVTPNYVYVNGDSYCTRYNTNLGSPQNFSRRDGIFSDLSNGQVYTLWSTVYSNFYNNTNVLANINAIRKMDASLNYGTTITLSQSINAGNGSIMSAGNGYLILWSNYDNNFYKIHLDNGLVEVLGNYELDYIDYGCENWATWGVAECGDNGHSIVFRTNYNFGSGNYNSMGRFEIGTNTFEKVTSFAYLHYIDLANFTYSPWNNRWYFTHEYSATGFGQYSENIVYADASVNNSTGYSSDYLWSTSDTTGYIVVNPSTTTNYSVSVTNGSLSCSDTVAITVIQSPTVSDTANSLSCYGDTNSTASLTVTGGTTPYTYAWSNSATTSSISNIGTGMYSYTVTGGNNCTVLDSVEVTSPTEILSTSTINTSATCYASANGSATVSVTGGTSGYTYLWPSGTTDTTDTQVSGGWNIVTITDANSCVITDSVFMTSPLQIDSAGPITSTTTFYCPGTSGTLIAANSGVGTVTNTYTNTSSTLSPSPTYTSPMNFTFNTVPTANVAGGTLKIYFKGDFGSSNEYLYLYDENGASIGNTYYPYYGNCSTYIVTTLTLTQAQLQSWLADGAITFTATPRYTVNGGTSCPTQVYMEFTYDYTENVKTFWFSSINTDTTQAIGTGGNLSIIPQSTTTYYAANFANGCNSSFDSITVIVPPAPTTSYVMNPTSICPGETAAINAYGASSYSWPSDPSISGSGSTATVSPTVTTDYLVTITNAFNCSYVDTMTIPVLDAPNGNILTTTNVTCSNASNGQAVVYATGGVAPYSYSWSNGNSGALQLGLVAGTYSVTISDNNTCSDTIDVTVGGPVPISFNAIVNNVSCNGQSDGSVTLALTGGTSPYSYSWSTGQTALSLSSLAPGSYSVTATDNGGCSHDTTITITEPTTLVASIAGTTPETCAGLGNGSITSGIVGGTTPYTYSWNNGGVGAMLSGLNGGLYSLTVTDANGCTAITSGTVITIPSTLALTINGVTNNVCYNGTLGAAIANGAGGNSPYSYNWSNGGTNSNLANVASGIYYVTVTDANSCQKVDSITLTEPSQLIVNNNVFSNATCFNTSTGSASVTASGATPGYTYAWSNGGTAFTNTTLSAGAHVVTVTDANSCTETTTVTITEPTALTLAATVTNISCNGLTDGAISITPSGGTPTYGYSWSSSQTTALISGLSVGTYTVTITDGNSCLKDTTVTITQPTSLDASISLSTNIACFGDATGAAVAGATGGTIPYSYLWSNTTAIATNTNLVAGSYIVTVTDANGCNDTSSVVLSQPATLLNVSISDTTHILCNSASTGSATALAVGGGTPYAYAWSNGITDSINTNLSAGAYNITVTDSYGCVKNTSVTITEPAIISLSVNALSNVTCNGVGDGSATINATGGTIPYTYLWSNGSATNTISSVGPGNYILTVTDANSCSDTISVTITEPTLLTATISNSQNVACNGSATGFAVVTGAGGTIPYTYLWSTNSISDSIYNQSSGFYRVTITDANGCVDSTLANLTQPSSLSLSPGTVMNNLCFGDALGSGQVVATGGAIPYNYSWPGGSLVDNASLLTSGAYVVTVTDANNCQDTTLISISEPNKLITTIDSQSDALCNGDTNGEVIVTVNGGVQNYVYSWNNGDVDTVLNNVGAGSYTITVTDNNSCMDTLTVTVTEPAILAVSLNVSNALCNTDTNGTILTTITGGITPYSYNWSNGDTVANAINLGANTYTVTVTDANGCADTLTDIITEPTLLDITVSNTTDVNCFGDYTGTATTVSSGGTIPYTYVWSGGQNIDNPTTLGAGLNQVILTDGNGCTDTTSTTLVALSNLDLSLVSISDILCNGDTTADITVTANGGVGTLSYTWSVAGLDSILMNQGAGSYVSYVIDNLGCSDTLNVAVSEPTLITGFSIMNQDPLCFGDSTGWAEISATGGTGTLNYLWPSGDTTALDSFLYSGTHVVTITDSNNCSNTYSVYLTDPAQLVNTGFNVTDVSCYFDVTGTVTVNPNGGILPYSISWSNGQSGANAIGLSGGNYTVSVEDANGCLLTDIASVSSINPLVPSMLPQDTSNCGSPIAITANSAFVNYNWSNSSVTSATVVITSSDTVAFSGLDVNGCYTYDTVIVNIYPAASVNLGSDISNICEGVAQNIDAGNSFVNYVWSNGDTTSMITVLTSGNYAVTATDINGCEATDDVDVSMWALPVVNLGLDTILCKNLGVTTYDIDAGAGFVSYQWSSGGLAQVETVTSDGDYSVIVENTNGCFGTDTVNVTFSVCSGIDEPSVTLNISMYPNPTNGDLNINLEGFMGESVEIQIMTTNGQLIKSKKIDSNNQAELKTKMDLSQVAQGLYFVVIKSGDQVKVERITVY
jgi:hypothetical protein